MVIDDIQIERLRPDDRPALDALYRRVHGTAENFEARWKSFRERWDWQYGRNPNLPDGLPLVWVVRDGETIAGQFATIPVRLVVNGTEIDAAWGTDAMVAPEHRGKGWGEALYRHWDRSVGAAIGLSYTDASYGLFKKMGWPYQGAVAQFTKPISKRKRATWKAPARSRAAAAALRWHRLVTALRPVGGEIERVSRFDERFTRLWERVAPKFTLAARRDAAYLNWRYLDAPSATYSAIALRRGGGGDVAGFAVYRHVEEKEQRTTVLVDFLADPDDRGAMVALLRGVERAARAARSDVVRAFATHAGFQETLRRSGFDDRQGTRRLVVKVNAVPVTPAFYAATGGWHVTRGDSDGDR